MILFVYETILFYYLKGIIFQDFDGEFKDRI